MRWSEADLDAARDRLAGQDRGARASRKSKLGNHRVEWQGQWFDSKKELRDFQILEQQRALGAIRAVIRQVSMPLPGCRRRIRVDFLVVENTGTLRWLDSKGFETDKSKLKRDQVLQAYDIHVELI